MPAPQMTTRAFFGGVSVVLTSEFFSTSDAIIFKCRQEQDIAIHGDGNLRYFVVFKDRNIAVIVDLPNT